MERILRRSGLIRRLVLGIVVALSASLALLVVTPSPANASAGYRCGTDFPWGPYCQVTFDRQISLTAKQLLVQGAGPAAVATWLCHRAPWFLTATCVFAAAKDGAELRDAINDAKRDSTKCVAIRVYQIAVSRDIARGIRAVNCFPTGGSGGGGGGGGGGSWRTGPRPLPTGGSW
jgi:hypothetical protein